ncbi:Lactose permease [Cyphellophora attinorum]|uniref:Lactose permease n=1 Tax=Cyphellophora attinorum TaxID=1664694 RepID=A0A0N1H2M1_9EURO|nr:Lactose permease [Phialophora attinorum]KPI34404.1 Lactose permease [Phialophora attinorum]
MVSLKSANIQAHAEETRQHALDDAPEFEKVNWKTNPSIRKLYINCALGLLIGSATTGYDGSLLNLLQQYDYWESYFDDIGTDASKSNLLGLLTNMFTIGSILSMFAVPTITDRFGRKACILSGCVFMVIGAIINTASQNYGMFCAGRFILGFGNSLSQLASPMLLTEVVHPQHRAPFTTIYNCLWNLGSFFCNAIGFGLSYYKSDWSWRILTLFQIIPALVQLVFVWGVPESPRWLISKDRHEEALQLLAKYHANGNEQDLTVQFEFREISETLKMEKHAAATTSYMDFFKTKGNRWRLAIIITIGVISQYSGNAVISNYANLIYEPALNLSISAALTVDKFGRRPLFLISAAGMTVCFVIWTALAGQFETHGGVESDSAKAYGIAQIPFIWIFGVFYAIGFSGLLVSYTLEVLPFFLRAKGVMIMNITVQAILALSAQTNPLAIHNLPHAWNFWLIYTIWDFLELIWVYFVFPETKGLTLEECAKIFDGEDAVAHISLEQTAKEIEIRHNETASEKHV